MFKKTRAPFEFYIVWNPGFDQTSINEFLQYGRLDQPFIALPNVIIINLTENAIVPIKNPARLVNY